MEDEILSFCSFLLVSFISLFNIKGTEIDQQQKKNVKKIWVKKETSNDTIEGNGIARFSIAFYKEHFTKCFYLSAFTPFSLFKQWWWQPGPFLQMKLCFLIKRKIENRQLYCPAYNSMVLFFVKTVPLWWGLAWLPFQKVFLLVFSISLFYSVYSCLVIVFVPFSPC